MTVGKRPRLAENEIETIKEQLKNFDLSHFETKLIDDYGMKFIRDFKLLTESDFKVMGCKILDLRKFKFLFESLEFKWVD